MRKFFILFLSLILATSLTSCKGKTSNDVKGILEKEGFEISLVEQFHKDYTRSINLYSKSKNINIHAYFKKSKAFLTLGFSNDGKDFYYTSDEFSSLKSIPTMKVFYQEWLSDVGIIEEDIEAYLSKLNTTMKKKKEVKEILKEYEFKYQRKAINDNSMKQFDASMEATSIAQNKKITLFFRKGRLIQFVYNDNINTGDSIFTYSFEKTTLKNSKGLQSYRKFLTTLNITHEDLQNFLTSLN